MESEPAPVAVVTHFAPSSRRSTGASTASSVAASAIQRPISSHKRDEASLPVMGAQHGASASASPSSSSRRVAPSTAQDSESNGSLPAVPGAQPVDAVPWFPTGTTSYNSHHLDISSHPQSAGTPLPTGLNTTNMVLSPATMMAASASLQRFGLGFGAGAQQQNHGMPPLQGAPPITGDPYVTQLQQRRFHLLIRSQPTDSQLHPVAPARVKTASFSNHSQLHGGGGSGGPGHGQLDPTAASLDAARLLQLGAKRLQPKASELHAQEAAVNSARNTARLHKMFGESSSYARKQRRDRAREEELAQAVAALRAQQQMGLGPLISPRMLRALKLPDTQQQQNQSSRARVGSTSNLQRHSSHGRLQQQQQQQQPQYYEEEKGNFDVDDSLGDATALIDGLNTRKALEALKLKQRKQVLAFLSPSPTQSPQHHFFDKLPRPPALTLHHAERLLDCISASPTTVDLSAASTVLGHLRVLEASGSFFSSVGKLIAAVQQLENREKTDRENRERLQNFPFDHAHFDIHSSTTSAPPLTTTTINTGTAAPTSPTASSLKLMAGGRDSKKQLLTPRGNGNSSILLAPAASAVDFEARVRAQALEKEGHGRAVAAVTDQDRARLVAFFTSTPTVTGGDEAASGSLGTYTVIHELSGRAEQFPVPTECHLFGDAELVSATPLQLSELIVSSGPTSSSSTSSSGTVDGCLAMLVDVDRSGRQFPSFAALSLWVASRGSEMREVVQARKDLLAYFQRGEELWKQREHIARGGTDSNTALIVSPRRTRESSSASTTAESKELSPRSSRRLNDASILSPRNPAPTAAAPACHLFLSCRRPMHIGSQEVDRLLDEVATPLPAGAGDALRLLQQLDARGEQASSFAQMLALLDAEAAVSTSGTRGARRRRSSSVSLSNLQIKSQQHRDAETLRRFLKDPSTRLLEDVSAQFGGSLRPDASQLLHAPPRDLLKEAAALPSGHISLGAFSLSRFDLAPAYASTLLADAQQEALEASALSLDDATALLDEVGGSLPLALSYFHLIALSRGGVPFSNVDELHATLRKEHAQVKRELLRFFREQDFCTLLRRPAEVVTSSQPATSSSTGSNGVDPSRLRMAHMEQLLVDSGLESPATLFAALLDMQTACGASSAFDTFPALLAALQSIASSLQTVREAQLKEICSILSDPTSLLLKKEHVQKLTDTDIQRLQQSAGEDLGVILRSFIVENPAAVTPFAPFANTTGRSSLRQSSSNSSPARPQASQHTPRFDSFDSLISVVSTEVAALVTQKQEILSHLLSKQSVLFAKVAWEPSIVTGSSVVIRQDDAPAVSAPLLPVASAASLRPNFIKHVIPGEVTRYSFGTELTRLAIAWNAPTLKLPASIASSPTGAQSQQLQDADVVVLNPAAANRLYRAGGTGPQTLRALWALEARRNSFGPNAAGSSAGGTALAAFRSFEQLITAVTKQHASLAPTAVAAGKAKAVPPVSIAAVSSASGSISNSPRSSVRRTASRIPQRVEDAANSDLSVLSTAASNSSHNSAPASPPLSQPLSLARASRTSLAGPSTSNSHMVSSPQQPPSTAGSQILGSSSIAGTASSTVATPVSPSRPAAAMTASSAAKMKPKLSVKRTPSKAAVKATPFVSSTATPTVAHRPELFPPPLVETPFVLSSPDKSAVLAYLSSTSCGLFRALATSPDSQTLAVRTADVAQMTQAAGDGDAAVRLMQRLDQHDRQFDSFGALVKAVQEEAARPADHAGITLDTSQCETLLSFLSSSPTLLSESLREEGALERAVSKADLLRLLWAAGDWIGRVSSTALMVNLQDLSAFGARAHQKGELNEFTLLPVSDFAQLLRAAEANSRRLRKLQYQLLLYLRTVQGSLFPSTVAPITLAAVQELMVTSKAGSLTQTHVANLVASGKQLDGGWEQLQQAITHAHAEYINSKHTVAAMSVDDL